MLVPESYQLLTAYFYDCQLVEPTLPEAAQATSALEPVLRYNLLNAFNEQVQQLTSEIGAYTKRVARLGYGLAKICQFSAAIVSVFVVFGVLTVGTICRTRWLRFLAGALNFKVNLLAN